MKVNLVREFKRAIEEIRPKLDTEKKERMYRILNPDVSDYEIYGIKVSELQKIVNVIFKEFSCDYTQALQVFSKLTRINNEEYKFVAFMFLNKFKKYFNEDTIEVICKEYEKHCHTWSHCDSTAIRLIGPFLGKKGNEKLAIKVVKNWSKNSNYWIKRASMVILIKIIMIRKKFEKLYVFALIEKMLGYTKENYIEKGIGWLLKTCAKYDQEIIYDYLIANRNNLTRLILRYASEKFPKHLREQVLAK